MSAIPGIGRRWLGRSALLLLLCGGGSGVTHADASLQEQLGKLAAERGFVIEGLAQLGNEPAGRAEGSTAEQLRHLLQDYNYVITQARPGVIDAVRIISRRGEGGPKNPTQGAYIATRRVGAHHQVDATLIGPNHSARSVALMIDTGATTLVLPSSMIPELGFAASDLQDGASQTASGTVPVKLGLLRTVRIGGASAANVEVSFIDDSKLQGNLLLGMSFLKRYKMTIDDASNELILMAR